MWELLQKLEDLGWKPYGKSIAELTETEKNVRLLTSLSSGLWQFCIENGLVEVDNNIPTLWEKRYKAPCVESIYKDDIHFEKEFEYRIIESSLKDESELEDFLLNSIKLD